MKGLALVALLALAGAVGAEGTPLEPLVRRDQLLGWEAVGRIDIGEAGFCTGTLIATDLVLTAAHCVHEGGAMVDPGTLTFRAGYVAGEALHEAAVARIVAHPGYRPGAPVSPGNVRHDVALLRLTQPIPAAAAAPFAVRLAGRGQAVSVVSYAAGREESLSWQRSCDVLARDGGLLALNCDVTFGASGAPVLDVSGGRPRIVAIISAGGPTEAGQIAYGMDLPDRIEELKELLRQPAAGGAAPGKPGDGRGRDIGARFLRP